MSLKDSTKNREVDAMKRSNKILLAVGGLLALLVVVLGGIFSYNLKCFVSTGEENLRFSFNSEKGMESRDYRFSDFDAIVTRGNWRLSVTKGGNWSVKIECDKALSKGVKVDKRGNVLYLEFSPGKKFKKKKAIASLIMPRFGGVKGEGGLDLYFEGFHGMNRLDIHFSGGLNLKGIKSDYNSLSLGIIGGGNINLRNVPIRDANVKIDGAGNVVLSMRGGELRGVIDGAGILTYYGNVKSRNVSINGVGKVYHR